VNDARARLLDDHLAAENRHDLDGIMETYGAGAVLVLNGHVFTDRSTILRAHDGLGFGDRGAFSDLRVEERARFVSPDAIVLEQRLSGRHTGPFEGIEPTGRHFEVPVCTVYVFGPDARLTSERVYFDRGLLRRQLGALT
jgi:predicted ester cyclase